MRPVSAAGTVVLAVAVALSAFAGAVPLALAVLLVQAVLVLAWPRALALPAAVSTVVVAASAAAAADALLVRDVGSRPLEPVAGVLGLVLIAALLAQLARRDGRERLVESLTATVTLGTLAVLPALYLTATTERVGAVAVALTVAGVAVGALPGAVPGPVSARLAAGVLLGAVAGALLAEPLSAATGDRSGIGALDVPATDGGWLGGVGGFAGVVGAYGGRLAPVTDRPVGGGRAAGLATTAALPVALAAPAAYALGRILLA